MSWVKNQKVYGRKIGKRKPPVGRTTGATRICRLAGMVGLTSWSSKHSGSGDVGVLV